MYQDNSFHKSVETKPKGQNIYANVCADVTTKAFAITTPGRKPIHNLIKTHYVEKNEAKDYQCKALNTHQHFLTFSQVTTWANISFFSLYYFITLNLANK